MGITRLKRKTRKSRAKATRRRTHLKIQNFKPVIKSVHKKEAPSETGGE